MKVTDLTILYTTDNALDKILAERCMEKLKEITDGIQIVSVSQKPIDLGKNICVGDIGRSGISMERQLEAGLEVIDTEYVAIAEHDCIYDREHYDWRPPDKTNFWYNDNCWLLQYDNPKFPDLNGQYSYWPLRRVLSQMICGTDIYRKAVQDRIKVINDPDWIHHWPTGRMGEPGAADYKSMMKISRHKELRHLRQHIKNYIINYNAKDFKTEIPNIDIRHGSNLTGPRRGRNRTFNLKPWGTMQELLRIGIEVKNSNLTLEEAGQSKN